MNRRPQLKMLTNKKKLHRGNSADTKNEKQKTCLFIWHFSPSRESHIEERAENKNAEIHESHYVAHVQCSMFFVCRCMRTKSAVTLRERKKTKSCTRFHIINSLLLPLFCCCLCARSLVDRWCWEFGLT